MAAVKCGDDVLKALQLAGVWEEECTCDDGGIGCWFHLSTEEQMADRADTIFKLIVQPLLDKKAEAV